MLSTVNILKKQQKIVVLAFLNDRLARPKFSVNRTGGHTAVPEYPNVPQIARFSCLFYECVK
jgi:hypothetical protein